MAAARQWALQAVRKLQVRLATTDAPEELQKALKMLSVLPIVADILEETGVRRTVKKLCHHDLVGPLARDLAARWKKLLHLERNRGSQPQDSTTDSLLQKHSKKALREEVEMDGDAQGTHRGPRSPAHRTEQGQNQPRILRELQEPRETSQKPPQTHQRKRRPRVAAAPLWNLESPAEGHVRASGGSTTLPQKSEDLSTQQKEPESTAPGQMPENGHPRDFQETPETLLIAGDWHGPQGQEVGSQSKSKGKRSSRKEKHSLGVKGQDTTPPWMAQKPHHVFSKQDTTRLFSGNSKQEASSSGGCLKEEDRESLGRNIFPASQVVSQDHLKKPRPRAGQETLADPKEPGPDSFHPGEGPAHQAPKDKAISNNLHTHKGELGSPPVYTKSVVDGFEELLQAFEEYCQEGQPPRKKKKTGKKTATSQREKELDAAESASRNHNSDLLQTSPLGSGHRSEELQLAEADAAKGRKAPTEAQPVLPGLPFPSEEVYSSAPPPGEWRSRFQAHGESPSSPQEEEEEEEEEEAAFPGHRIHARTPVFPGSRRGSFLPKLTFNQQDMQDLTKDLDSNSDERGGLYAALEPRLGKCTPDDLFHLEGYNQGAGGETDKLWKMRCLKDYKEEKPREHESWREMYLRLQHAREQQLQALTHRIQSAQAQKPQDRRTQTIIFTSVGKPPQEAPGRQERLAMPGEAPPSLGSKKTASGSDSHPPGKKPNPPRTPLAPLLNTNKPTAKKMAPLMAKAMKDYRKTISRR